MVNLSGDPAQDNFTNVMTDALIHELYKISALERVSSFPSVMAYKGVSKSLPEIAGELKVEAIVQASLLRESDRVQINANLIKADSETPLWTETFEQECRNTLKLPKDLAQAIVGRIHAWLTDQEATLLSGAREIIPAAFDAYLQGSFHFSRYTIEDFRIAIQYFNRAVEIDSNYALAYLGLAQVYGLLPFLTDFPPEQIFPEAKAAAKKAIELDSILGEAYGWLGWSLASYDWDWSGAEQAYQRGVAIQPSSSRIHRGYGWILSWMERHDEAIAEMEKGIDLDPLSSSPFGMLSGALTMARRFDEAIESGKKAVKMAPDHNLAHQRLAMAYAGKGMYKEAIDEYRKAVDPSGGFRLWKAALGHTFAVNGQRDDALKILHELKQPSEYGYISSDLIAKIYLGLGDKEKAFIWLKKELNTETQTLFYLKSCISGIRSGMIPVSRNCCAA